MKHVDIARTVMLYLVTSLNIHHVRLLQIKMAKEVEEMVCGPFAKGTKGKVNIFFKNLSEWSACAACGCWLKPEIQQLVI